MQLPEKEYLTFSDLAVQWKCTKSYLHHLVATKKIKPSAFLNDEFFRIHWEDEEIDGELYSKPTLDRKMSVAGLFYLQTLTVTGLDTYYFTHFSRLRDPSPHTTGYPWDKHANEDDWFGFHYNDELSSTQIEEWGVFMQEEIVRFQKKYVESSGSAPTLENEKVLSTREKNTLLKIIRALCVSQGLDLKQPYKDAEIIKNGVELLGGSLSIETIVDKLEQAKLS